MLHGEISKDHPIPTKPTPRTQIAPREMSARPSAFLVVISVFLTRIFACCCVCCVNAEMPCSGSVLMTRETRLTHAHTGTQRGEGAQRAPSPLKISHTSFRDFFSSPHEPSA